MAVETDPLAGPKPLTASRSRAPLFCCLFALCFLSSADSTMVSTLLGKISHDLQAQRTISWVATSYLLACASFQPLFGKTSDVFGRKFMIQLCITLFTLGCIICGYSTNLKTLVLGRFITGIGGGGLSSLVTIVMSDLVSLRDRGMYNGYIGVFLDLGAVSGGVLAGLVDELWGWQWSFWGQVPLCIIIAFGISFWFHPEEQVHEQVQQQEQESEQVHEQEQVQSEQGESRQTTVKTTHMEKLYNIDWIGSFLLTTSLFTLMLSFSISLPKPYQYILLGYWMIGFPLFYYHESKTPEAIIPVELLHNRTIFITCIHWWLMCSNFYTYVYYLPFYWSSAQGKSSLQCGYLFSPSTIISTLAALFTGYILKLQGHYHSLHIAAGLLISVGSCLVYLSQTTWPSWLDSVISLPLRFGTTINHTVMLIVMISSVRPQQRAMVTSIQYGFKSLGSTMGLAMADWLMQMSLDKYLVIPDEWQPPRGWTKEDVLAILAKARADPGVGWQQKLPETVREIVVGAYDSAGHVVFGWLVFTGLGCAVCVALTPKKQLT